MKEVYTVLYKEVIEIYNESDGTSFTEDPLTYMDTVFSLSFDNMEALKKFDLNYILNFNLYKPIILKNPCEVRGSITNEFEIEYGGRYKETCDIIEEDLCKFGPDIATDFKTEKETNPKLVSDVLKFLVEIRDVSELCSAYIEDRVTIFNKTYELHRDYLCDEMIYIDINVRCCIVSSPMFTGDDNEFVEYELIKNLEA